MTPPMNPAPEQRMRLHPVTLNFADDSLEVKYREVYRRASIRTFLSFAPWATFTVAVGFAILVGLFPAVRPILYLYGMAVWVLVAALVHFKYFKTSYRQVEIHFTLMAVLFGWLDSALLVWVPAFAQYVWAMVAVHLVSSSLALPVRFLPAVVNQSVVLIGFAGFAFGLSDLTTLEAVIQLVFLNGIASFCFYATYWRERGLRENFLQQETIRSYSRALDAELEKGRKIQRDFLPGTLPSIPDCDPAAFFCPALQLSGDFYDLFALPGNRVGLVIADVSDKGVGSALFMALLRSLIRVFSGHVQMHCDEDPHCGGRPGAMNRFFESAVPDPAAALNAVALANEYMAHEHGEEGMFATLFFGSLDPATGSLLYVNGGHEPLMVAGSGGLKGRLMPTGPAVGMMPGIDYGIGSFRLDAGDLLFGYTDGVTEARSPADQLYARNRLEQSVLRAPRKTAAGFLEAIRADLFDFIEQAPQSDDITMVALRWR